MSGDLKRIIKLILLPLIGLFRNFKRIAYEFWWLSKRNKLIKNYYNKEGFKGLNIGCGANKLSGWLNADFTPNSPDIIFLDATQKFPLESNSFDYVFAEHMIEHISYDQAIKMLEECYRILKPGGRIRIATPDLCKMIALFSQHKSEEQIKYIEWFTNKFAHSDAVRIYHETFVLNKMVREWGHQFIFDEFALTTALTNTGFKSCARYTAGESDDKNLVDIDGHNNVSGQDVNSYETLVIEGIK